MVGLSNTFRILIVDDNLEIHSDFKKVLSFEKLGDENLADLDKKLFGEHSSVFASLPHFQIDSAMQGEEGCRMAREAQASQLPYAIIFVDVRMPPGIDGIEVTKEILKIDKHVQIVICTAYSDYAWDNIIEELGLQENLFIIKKPFDSITVRQLVVSCVKKWQRLRAGNFRGF